MPPQSEVIDTHAESGVWTRLDPVAGWYLSMFEFPRNLVRRPEPPADTELAGSGPVGGTQPEVVIARAIDLGFEHSTIGRHRPSLVTDPACSLGHPECPGALD